MGYNSVRLWLNYAAFEEMGPRMVDRVEDAIGLCTRHHLKAVVNLFDSCGIRPRKDARAMTAPEAYDLFQQSPRFTKEQKALMQQLFGSYVRGYGKNTIVRVGADTPMTILLFQEWQSTPGNDHLTSAFYPQLESYVDAAVGRLKNNPGVLLWDLGYRELMENGSASIIMPDVGWCGGISEARKIANWAETHYLPIAPHNCAGPVTHFASWHLAMASHNFLILETVRRHYGDRFVSIATDPGAPERGRLGIPPGPGLGVELKPEFLNSGRTRIESAGNID